MNPALVNVADFLTNRAAEQFHNSRAKAMKRNNPDPEDPYWIQDENGVWQYVGVDEEQLDLSEIYISRTSEPKVKVVKCRVHIGLPTWADWALVNDAMQSPTCEVKKVKRRKLF
jgi:hypothetical protein